MEEPLRLFDRQSLESQLEQLWDSNSYLATLCISRHALRCLPILGITVDPFSFWQHYSSPIKQSSPLVETSTEPLTNARHLLALFMGAKSSEIWATNHLKNELTNAIDDTVKHFVLAPRISREALRNTELPVAYACAYACDAASVSATAESASDFSPYTAAAIEEFAQSEEWSTEVVKSEFRELGKAIVVEVLQLWLDDIEAASNNNVEAFLKRPLLSSKVDQYLESGLLGNFIDQCKHLISDLGSEQPPALGKLTHFYLELHDNPGPIQQNRNDPTDTISPETLRSQKEDFLGRSKLVAGLARILSSNENKGHLTVGLFGHWGSGKTRVIDLLRNELINPDPESPPLDNQFQYCEFNAWSYEHSKNIQAAMAHEVFQSLTSIPARKGDPHPLISQLKHRWVTTTRFIMKKHPKRLIWLAVLLLFSSASLFTISATQPGDLVESITRWQSLLPLAAMFEFFRSLRNVLARPLTKEMMSYLKLPNYAEHIGLVPEMASDIRLMCNVSLVENKRLLFVVDDLDRCGPEGIIKTFEAIRLILDIPKVRVILAVDQRIALAALAHHYRDIAEHHPLSNAKAIAHDYLGKMVHLPITLSEPTGEDLTGFLAHIWGDSKEQSSDWLQYLDSDVDDSNEELDSNTGSTPNITVPQPITGFDSKDLPLLEQLDSWIMALPKMDPPIELTINLGMDASQKAAFVYWSETFALNNPRQLKRLTNSYNLLRLVSNFEDTPIYSTDVPHAYGILIGLFTLEFINSEENSEQQTAFEYALMDDHYENITVESDKTLFKNVNSVLDETVNIHPGFNSRFDLVNFVNQFVLPAFVSGEVIPE
jgi:hypothetical protein